jgi:hypothetical protein
MAAAAESQRSVLAVAASVAVVAITALRVNGKRKHCAGRVNGRDDSDTRRPNPRAIRGAGAYH